MLNKYTNVKRRKPKRRGQGWSVHQGGSMKVMSSLSRSCSLVRSQPCTNQKENRGTKGKCLAQMCRGSPISSAESPQLPEVASASWDCCKQETGAGCRQKSCGASCHDHRHHHDRA